MRELVKIYLQKPDPQLLRNMTTEEQRYVERQAPAKKGRAKGKGQNGKPPPVLPQEEK